MASTTSTCSLCDILRYYHRCINIPKLVNVGFTHVPSNMTLARMIRLHKVPERPKHLAQGLREMEEKDVPQVADLYKRYQDRFGMSLHFSEDEVRHNFLSGRGVGPGGKDSWKRRREEQVVWTYVIEVCTTVVPNALSTCTHCVEHRTPIHTRSRTSGPSIHSPQPL